MPGAMQGQDGQLKTGNEAGITQTGPIEGGTRHHGDLNRDLVVVLQRMPLIDHVPVAVQGGVQSLFEGFEVGGGVPNAQPIAFAQGHVRKRQNECIAAPDAGDLHRAAGQRDRLAQGPVQCAAVGIDLQPPLEQSRRGVAQREVPVGQQSGCDQPQVRDRHPGSNHRRKGEVEHFEASQTEVGGYRDHQQIRGGADGGGCPADQGAETHGHQNFAGRGAGAQTDADQNR